MLLFGLSSGNKTAIVVVAAIFVAFALLSSMLIPRWRPQFPGRALWLFVAICVLLFLGMMTTVIVFGKESKAAGSSAKLTVTLQSGTYDFYCSIPGHKAAGMDQKVTVS